MRGPPPAWQHQIGPSRHARGGVLVARVNGGATIRLDASAHLMIAEHRVFGGNDALARQAADVDGTTEGEAIVRIAVALQRALQHDVAEPPAATEPGVRVVPVWDAAIGMVAARAASELVAAAAAGRGAVARIVLDQFLAAARRISIEESGRRLLGLAARRGIAWARVVPNAPIFRIGHGARQVRLDGSSLTSTGKIADTISIRKSLASALLRQHGLPAPASRLVGTVEGALRAAAELGLPVVIKPDRTNYGTAVSTGLRDEAAIRKAFAAAAAHGRVLVEQHIVGDHARLLVFQGRFLSSVRQDPAQVVGDGRSTVAALVQAVNAGRTETLSSQFQRIAIDDEAHDLLRQQDLAIDSVPVEGRRVRLRFGSNTSRGGTAWNVTPRVHPDNARLAERATAVLGLDLAGVDLITPDIERSFREVGGMICEINSGPGLYMREPGEMIEAAILDGMFPGDRPGRIPIVAVLDEREDGGVADAVAARLSSAFGPVATVARSRAAVGGWPYVASPDRLHDAAAAVLGDPQAAAAVLSLPAEAVREDGLAFRRCDLAVIPAGADPLAAQLLAATATARVDPGDAGRLADAVDRLMAEWDGA